MVLITMEQVLYFLYTVVRINTDVRRLRMFNQAAAAALGPDVGAVRMPHA